MSKLDDPKLSFWCLACPTRVHVEVEAAKGHDTDDISLHECPVCHDSMWDLRSLIKSGFESGPNDENYKVPRGTSGTDAEAHKKLLDFIVNGEAEIEKARAERQLEVAQKRLSDLKKRKIG